MKAPALGAPSAYVAICIVLLSCAMYVPFLTLPFLSDDYLQITLGRKFGHPGEWRLLLEDPLYRNRATSLIVTYWTDLLYPLSRLALGVSSILLHALNGLLVYALGAARSIGWRLSAGAAVVFVLQERHHEAVIWYAALPELLVFFFSLSSVVLWIHWLRSERGSFALWFGAFVCFALALFSKESAVATVLLMIVVSVLESSDLRRTLAAMCPFAIVAALYAAAVFSGSQENHHFVDGTFAFQAGFVKTLLLSAGRGLWVWGWLGLIVLALFGRSYRMLLFASLAWMIAALLPYSFLDYMETVPSRHHYLAAVGCSLIVAIALQTLLERTGSTRLIAGLVIIIGIHHASYLWTSKYRQFQKRAEPIESFLGYLRDEPRRPVIIYCSDYYFSEVQRAAFLRLREPVDNLVLDFTGGDGTSPSYCLDGPPGNRPPATGTASSGRQP